MVYRKHFCPQELGGNLRPSDYQLECATDSLCKKSLWHIFVTGFPAVSVVTGRDFPAVSVVTDFPAVSVLSGRDRKAFLAWEKTLWAAEKCPGIVSRIVYPRNRNFLTIS